MEVFNIHPDNIQERSYIYQYQYTFLDGIYKDINMNKYYQLLLSIDTFKLKNLYNFLFLRSLKLNSLFSVRKMVKNKYIRTPEEFNLELEKYIQKEGLYSIIIMNGIQQFFIPLNQ